MARRENRNIFFCLYGPNVSELGVTEVPYIWFFQQPKLQTTKLDPSSHEGYIKLYIIITNIQLRSYFTLWTFISDLLCSGYSKKHPVSTSAKIYIKVS